MPFARLHRRHYHTATGVAYLDARFLFLKMHFNGRITRILQISAGATNDASRTFRAYMSLYDIDRLAAIIMYLSHRYI